MYVRTGMCACMHKACMHKEYINLNDLQQVAALRIFHTCALTRGRIVDGVVDDACDGISAPAQAAVHQYVIRHFDVNVLQYTYTLLCVLASSVRK